MKRINEKTGEPFKWGDVRDDGFFFRTYQKTIKKDGYFSEVWSSPKANEKRKLNDKNVKKRAYFVYSKTNGGKASILLNAAKARGNVSISKEWVEQKLNNGLCELSGLPFDISGTNGFKANPYAPSLDRIDPKNREYSPENTRVILLSLNVALSEYGIGNLLTITRAMSERQGL